MFMETSVKERLKQFIDTLNISEREFCRRIGVSSSYVMSIKKSIQPDKMQAISIQFPELNPLWLLLGQGEMLLPNEKKEGEQRQNPGECPPDCWLSCWKKPITKSRVCFQL